MFLIDEEYQEMIIQKKVFHPLGNLLTTSIFFFFFQKGLQVYTTVL